MKKTKQQLIIIRLANWRAYILHILEDTLPAKYFPEARTTVLKALGDNGLKGDIEDIFNGKTGG